MTMKEVLDKMRDLASQSLKTLKDVYDFHTNTEVTWWDECELDDLIEREIEERENVLSETYYNLMMEIEKEVNEQFKDVNDNISYSLDYDDDDTRTTLSYININITDDWILTIGQHSEFAEHNRIVLNGDHFPHTNCRYYPEEYYGKGVKELVTYWRTVYDKYVAG